MVFNATFNNIISWWSVLLVDDTGEYPEKITNLLQVTDKLYCIEYTLSQAGFELTTLVERAINTHEHFH